MFTYFPQCILFVILINIITIELFYAHCTKVQTNPVISLHFLLLVHTSGIIIHLSPGLQESSILTVELNPISCNQCVL